MIIPSTNPIILIIPTDPFTKKYPKPRKQNIPFFVKSGKGSHQKKSWLTYLDI